jgi:hypothetical protein
MAGKKKVYLEKTNDTPEYLVRELTELRSAISRADKLAISGQAAIQALHESERQLSTLMSNLPGMVFRLLNDKNWTIDFVSMKERVEDSGGALLIEAGELSGTRIEASWPVGALTRNGHKQ